MPWLLSMTILIAVIILATNLYLGWRFWKVSKRLAANSWAKWIPIIALASFYLFPLAGLLHFLIGGEPNLLEYPKFLTYWFWFGLVLSFQLLTYIIILDVLKLIANALLKQSRKTIYKYYSRAVLVITVILIAFTAIKMWNDTHNIEVEYVTYHSTSIPGAFSDFRIVHISDLQGDEYTGREDIADYIRKVNSLNPDLVIFTGDLISYGTDFIDMAAEELSKVNADYGLYAVIGDHDYWARVSNIKSAYQKYEINLLRNENKIITAEDDSLLLTGITEVYSKHINRDSLQQLAAGYENVPFEIMASHQATSKVVQAADAHNYELLLAGHTHGGQIRVPFMFMHFSAPSMETPYLSGPYKIGDLLLNINNGLGFTLAPVRYDAQPSISVITLKEMN